MGDQGKSLNKMDITDDQFKNAFKGTNFGEINDNIPAQRKYVAQSVMKRACGYSTGHTMQCILVALGLIGPKTLKPNKDAMRWMYDTIYSRT